MKRKAIIISFCFIAVLCMGLTVAYFAYGSTMLNAYDDKALADYLAYDKSKPVEILAKKTHRDYVAVLFKDPIDKENGESDEFAHFYAFKRHKLYKNRFILSSRDGDGWEYISFGFHELTPMDSTHSICFAHHIANNETKCFVFEYDLNLKPVRKLDEFELPEAPFIIAKEYDLLSRYHCIGAINANAEAEIDYDNYYNENWEKDDEQFIDTFFKAERK